MTTPEERIKAAAEALKQEVHVKDPSEWAKLAEHTLAAAYPEDFPPKPKWPSDESVIRFKAAYRSSAGSGIPMSDEWVRDCLREAMTPDPIIKAAVAHRRAAEGGWSHYHCPVCEAVDEAGL